MRGCFSVEVEPVPVKSPAKGRVFPKVAWICRAHEIYAQAFVHGIGLPKSAVAPEIREAGIHSHARPGVDDEGLGFANVSCGLYVDLLHGSKIWKKLSDLNTRYHQSHLVFASKQLTCVAF